MNKRGQATIFIIIGIILLVVVSLLFVFLNVKTTGNIDSQVLEDETFLFVDYAEECVDSTKEDMIYTVGKQLYALDLGIEYTNTDVPIFYSNKQNNVPEIALVEEELQALMEDDLRYCLEEYEPGQLDEIKINDVSVEFGEYNSVNVEAKLSDGEKSASISEEFEFELGIENYFSAANLFVLDYIENNGDLCVDCVFEYNEKYGVTFSMNPYDKGQIVAMKNENLIIKGEPYEFEFALED